MATNRDFEKLWKRYQDDVQSTGKSIATYQKQIRNLEERNRKRV